MIHIHSFIHVGAPTLPSCRRATSAFWLTSIGVPLVVGDRTRGATVMGNKSHVRQRTGPFERRHLFTGESKTMIWTKLPCAALGDWLLLGLERTSPMTRCSLGVGFITDGPPDSMGQSRSYMGPIREKFLGTIVLIMLKLMPCLVDIYVIGILPWSNFWFPWLEVRSVFEL